MCDLTTLSSWSRSASLAQPCGTPDQPQACFTKHMLTARSGHCSVDGCTARAQWQPYHTSSAMPQTCTQLCTGCSWPSSSSSLSRHHCTSTLNSASSVRGPCIDRPQSEQQTCCATSRLASDAVWCPALNLLLADPSHTHPGVTLPHQPTPRTRVWQAPNPLAQPKS